MPETTQDPQAAQTSVRPPDVSIVSVTPAGVSDMLSSIVNISSGGTYHEPSCPFCSSSHRREAESLIGSLDVMVKNQEERVSAYFRSVGESVSEDAVRNHVKNHLRRGDVELRKIEYIGKLSNLVRTTSSTADQVRLAIAVVLECLLSASEVVPSRTTSPTQAHEARAAIVTKLVKAWTDLLAMYAKVTGEMERRGEVIVMPTDAFNRVFDRALIAAKSLDDKQVVHGILKDLTAIIQE